MPKHITSPTVVPAVGTKPKRIEEYVGRVNSETSSLSIARMKSPAGWVEPGQRPEFDEFTLVLEGCLHVEHEGGLMKIEAGQAVIAEAGEWVRYSTPDLDTQYVAVCLPAFSPSTVNRDD